MRKAILKHATESQITLLREIIVNLLIGNLPLSGNNKSKLKKYKKKLRNLNNNSLSLASKRAIIQSGGGTFLIPILSTFLSSALGRLIQ